MGGKLCKSVRANSSDESARLARVGNLAGQFAWDLLFDITFSIFLLLCYIIAVINCGSVMNVHMHKNSSQHFCTTRSCISNPTKGRTFIVLMRVEERWGNDNQ